MPVKRTTVLLAEKHLFVRDAFRRLLELESDFELVGEAQDRFQTESMATRLCPDVVLMDIASGLDATRQVLKTLPATRILFFLSEHSTDLDLVKASNSGAAGLLLKLTSSFELCRAIRRVLKGQTFLSASFSARLERLRPESPLAPSKVGKLDQVAEDVAVEDLFIDRTIQATIVSVKGQAKPAPERLKGWEALSAWVTGKLWEPLRQPSILMSLGMGVAGLVAGLALTAAFVIVMEFLSPLIVILTIAGLLGIGLPGFFKWCCPPLCAWCHAE